MALFGYQLLTTIIVATFLVKLSPILSPVDFLCSRLKFYFPRPEASSLLAKKGKKSELELQEYQLQIQELHAIKYYGQCRDLVHYALASVVVYTSNCLYWALYTSSASKEFNFSMCWVGISLLQWVRLAVLVTRLYFTRSSLHSEGLMCLASTAGGVVLAAILLVAGEDYFSPPLSLTIRSLEAAGISEAVAMVIVCAVTITMCGAIASALTFPAMRLARERRRLLAARRRGAGTTTTTVCDVVFRVLARLHLYLPHAAALCFFKPGLHYVAYDLFDLPVSEPDLQWGVCLLVALYGLLSGALAGRLLQIYLNRAPDLTQQQQQAGSRSDQGRRELVELVSYVPKYFGVILAQMALPVVLLLSLSFLSAIAQPHLCCLAYSRDVYHTSDGGGWGGVVVGPLFRFLLMFSLTALSLLSSIGTLYYTSSD